MTKLEDAKALIDQAVSEQALTDAIKDANLVNLTNQVADLKKQLVAATAPTAPTTPVVDKRFVWSFRENFNYADGAASSRIPSSVAWGAYDGVKGTAGVGMRKGSLATIRSGQLVLAGERPNANESDWNKFTTTGVAFGPKAQLYGRFEARIKSGPGAGFWTNLQLWPTAGKQAPKFNGGDGWSETIEVDISETPKPDRSEANVTIHYGPNNSKASPPAAVKKNFQDWHTWTVEWLPESLTILCDGGVVWRVTDKALIPSTPHHLVAQIDAGNWALRATSSDPVRVEYFVDYVEQWAYKAA